VLVFIWYLSVYLSVLWMQGHEEAHIDPWEDPSFDIYHTTDRYGFIQYVTFLEVVEVVSSS